MLNKVRAARDLLTSVIASLSTLVVVLDSDDLAQVGVGVVGYVAALVYTFTGKGNKDIPPNHTAPRKYES